MEQSKQEIQSLKDNLQQSHVENAKLQKENVEIQKEKDEMSERIRFLEEQLAKAKD